MPGISGPAIDCLMNQYAENTHAQFGNAPHAQGALQRRQPARHEPHALRGLWRRRLGPPVRGYEAHRRLAGSAGRQHPQPASLLRDDSRRPQARPSPVLLLSRAVVGRLSRLGGIPRARLAGPFPGGAGQPGARARTDHHRLDVSGRRGKAQGDRRFVLQAADGPRSGASRI